MRIAYFDSPSGASGDMVLGALFDAGLDPGELESHLRTIPGLEFRIRTERASRHGIEGIAVSVEAPKKEKARGLPEIELGIDALSLPGEVKERAKRIFRVLGRAEAKVHGVPIEKVHFHEVGAVDSIVDVVGAVVGLHLLGVEEVFASPPSTGTGTVRAAHGVLPLPAPATVEILRGRPVRPTSVEGELLTPTGAAILVGLTDRFGPPPPYSLEEIGYGVGRADRKELPNVLRVLLGRLEGALPSERLLLLETDLDDATAEVLGHLFERALEEGALDLQLLPTVMKKNRPGHRVSLLARPEDRERLLRLLMEETGTLGVRCIEADRIALPRSIEERETRFGMIRCKRSELPGGRIRSVPEYEECARLAREKGLPLLEVWEKVLADLEEKT
jgi:uncharacterized protein (TIGR00299 family) protein